MQIKPGSDLIGSILFDRIVDTFARVRSSVEVASNRGLNAEALRRFQRGVSGVRTDLTGKARASTETQQIFDSFANLHVAQAVASGNSLADWVEANLTDGQKSLLQTPLEFLRVKYLQDVVFKFLTHEAFEHSLRNGGSAFAFVTGQPGFEPFVHYDDSRDLLQLYATGFFAMNKASDEVIASALLKGPLSSLKRDVLATLDVGAGVGSFSSALARTLVGGHHTLLELPSSRALFEILRPWLLDEKFMYEPIWGGFDISTNEDDAGPLPSLAGRKFDLVSLGWILHDWKDATCARLLSRIRTHHLKSSDSVIVALENCLPSEPGLGHALDFLMLVMADGVERSEQEYRALGVSAGLSRFERLSCGARREALIYRV